MSAKRANHRELFRSERERRVKADEAAKRRLEAMERLRNELTASEQARLAADAQVAGLNKRIMEITRWHHEAIDRAEQAEAKLAEAEAEIAELKSSIQEDMGAVQSYEKY